MAEEKKPTNSSCTTCSPLRVQEGADQGGPRRGRSARQDRRSRHQGPQGTWRGVAVLRGRADAARDARLPKIRGFTNPNKEWFTVVNVARLKDFDEVGSHARGGGCVA